MVFDLDSQEVQNSEKTLTFLPGPLRPWDRLLSPLNLPRRQSSLECERGRHRCCLFTFYRSGDRHAHRALLDEVPDEESKRTTSPKHGFLTSKIQTNSRRTIDEPRISKAPFHSRSAHRCRFGDHSWLDIGSTSLMLKTSWSIRRTTRM